MNKPRFLSKMNWSLLRLQKSTLLEVIQDYKDRRRYALDSQDKETAENHEETIRDLEGILNLIDAIQDYAVDGMGYSEKTIFNLRE